MRECVCVRERERERKRGRERERERERERGGGGRKTEYEIDMDILVEMIDKTRAPRSKRRSESSLIGRSYEHISDILTYTRQTEK